MNPTTNTGKTLTDAEIAAIATDFETADIGPDTAAKIKKTRRTSPRLGDTKAEVVTFRAPSDYKARIKQRATAESRTESQIIRAALDAYLEPHE